MSELKLVPPPKPEKRPSNDREPTDSMISPFDVHAVVSYMLAKETTITPNSELRDDSFIVDGVKPEGKEPIPSYIVAPREKSPTLPLSPQQKNKLWRFVVESFAPAFFGKINSDEKQERYTLQMNDLLVRVGINAYQAIDYLPPALLLLKHCAETQLRLLVTRNSQNQRDFEQWQRLSQAATSILDQGLASEDLV